LSCRSGFFIISISFARGEGMLFIYGGGSGQAHVQQLPQSAKSGNGDARLRRDGQGGAGGLVEHPRGNLQRAWRIGIEPTPENRSIAP
jgi:hypothetical protein